MSRIYATFNGRQDGLELGISCLELLHEQRTSWPQLRKAYEALEQAKYRELVCNGFSVRLLHNPGRLTSTAASVKAADIDQRPCFLCGHLLPGAQKAVLYRNEYLILVNPMPVMGAHFTIPHVSHRPQTISGNIEALLHIAADFGQDWTLLYNGPRCGASAPDHLHFQALPSGSTPIEHEIGERRRLVPYGADQNGTASFRVQDVGREAILFIGEEPFVLATALSHYLENLRRMTESSEDQEPMINVLAQFLGHAFRVVVFPRRKHRPEVFFKEGDNRIVVSPAVVEMAGIIVTPFEHDFERLDSATIEAIYREVSLNP